MFVGGSMKIQVAVHGYSDIKTEAAIEPCTTRLPFVLCNGSYMSIVILAA